LRTSTDGAVTQFRDWGVPLGRRFRALKLWFLIRTQGVDGLARRLRRDIAHASRFAQIVRTTPDWRVVGDVPLQTVCVRHEPHGLRGKALDTHTRAWVAALNASGKAYLTAALVDGAWLARVSIGALVTEWPHIERLWQDMQEYAEQTSG
jgi:aromatic-L-amino-acid decarboxylase